MSAPLQSLFLEHAHISFDISSYREQERVIRDIQTIHDPSRSRLSNLWKRCVGMNGLTLSANPQSSIPSLDGAHVTAAPHEKKVHIRWDNPSLSHQAMGYAAIQLYGQLLYGEPLVQLMNATDPLEETTEKAYQREAIGMTSHIMSRESMGEPHSYEEYSDGLMFLSSLPQHGESGTRIILQNKFQKPLPQLLKMIQDAYDEMYIGANTSAAVAGIVGAKSLEAFNLAWNDAAQYKPAAAARKLLENMATS